MKKLICITLALTACFTFSGCNGKENQNAQGTMPPQEELSGMNAQVSAETKGKETKFTFEGYMSTTLPEGVYCEDISANSDSSLFSVTDGKEIYLDISYSEKGTSADELKKDADNIAGFADSKRIQDIKIDGIEFYGVSMPTYGKTQYMGYVNGQDVTVSVYADLGNDVVKKFLKTTEFVK